MFGWIGLADLRFVRAEGVLGSSETALAEGREGVAAVSVKDARLDLEGKAAKLLASVR